MEGAERLTESFQITLDQIESLIEKQAWTRETTSSNEKPVSVQGLLALCTQYSDEKKEGDKHEIKLSRCIPTTHEESLLCPQVERSR